MTFSAVIAIAFWGAFTVTFVSLAVYHLWAAYLERWLDRFLENQLWEHDIRGKRRDLRRKDRALKQLRAKYERLPAGAVEDRAVAGFCSYLGDLADQAREIQNLPTISDRDRNRRVA